MSEIGVHRPGSGREVVETIDRPIGRRRSDRIVGAARATQEIVDQAMAAARADLPVVITGPEGSGKEHTARAIHAWSDRAAQPFVTVSCATTPEPLLARELFGCGAGAYPLHPGEYTGALARAAGGTLLVGRIDRMPAPVLQAFVEAVRRQSFRREGDRTSIPLRARVVVTSIVQPETSPLGDVPQHTIRVAPISEG